MFPEDRVQAYPENEEYENPLYREGGIEEKREGIPGE